MKEFKINEQGITLYVDKHKVGTISWEIQTKMKRLIVNQVLVMEAYRNQGFASKLVEKCLDYAIKKNYVIVPKCSYVKKYLQAIPKKSQNIWLEEEE